MLLYQSSTSARFFIMSNNILVEFIITFLIVQMRCSTLKFPDNFKFGVATASYQIEGAWNESGKGENIWDRLTHAHPEWVADRSNGDIACDSYHKFEEDIKNLKWLGVDFYRFSLSWSRLLPSGYANIINQDGVRYYNQLIDGLIAQNITPMVTLYHWDLPQPLQEIGGWPNILLVDYFEDYAKTAFKLFGDRVKLWITFNEPPQTCQSGYGEADDAPAYDLDGVGPYLCGRTLLLAHARVYHLYNKEFKKTQKGKVGITINGHWVEPKTNSVENVEAANKSLNMTLGWWAHPIFSKTGDYPEIMKESIAKNSKEENFPRSRLIPFTADEVKYIQGTHDFFGLNHYSTIMVVPGNKTWKVPSFEKDVGVIAYYDPKWPGSAAPWLKVVPWGFRKLLNWVKTEYDNPEIIITENGYADHPGELEDIKRINYHQEYLEAVLKAIHIDGCNILGYTAWSLMDNLEWRAGYTQRFGLFYVNMTNANRTRIAKKSASVYKSIIATKELLSDVNIEVIL